MQLQIGEIVKYIALIARDSERREREGEKIRIRM
jgi:hypothetical protein